MARAEGIFHLHGSRISKMGGLGVERHKPAPCIGFVSSGVLAVHLSCDVPNAAPFFQLTPCGFASKVPHVLGAPAVNGWACVTYENILLSLVLASHGTVLNKCMRP